MKNALILGLFGLLAGTLSAAESSPQDTVISAAKGLGDKPNYSWTITLKEGYGNSGRFPPIVGKTDKSGIMYLKTMDGATSGEVYMNGQKGTAGGPGGWQTFDELAKLGGFAAAIVRHLRLYKTPSAECGVLAGALQNVKEEQGILSGELKGDAAKEYLEPYIPPFAGQPPPKIADPRGSVKFWIGKGMLTKYEINVQCRVIRSDQESEFQRTTTVEIKNVGTTKLEVPEGAKQKLL